MAEQKDYGKMTLPERLRAHADTMFFKIPAGEQYIGARDAVLHTVLLDLAAWIEQHDPPAKSRRSKRSKDSE